MNSIVLIPLFVAVATAASLYPRNPASTYLLNYPIQYPANYPVEIPFNYGVQARQGGVPLPILLAQQTILGLGNIHTQNTAAFWNLMNCLVDSSCPTVTLPPAVAVSTLPAPNRLMTLIQQLLNNPTNNQPNVFQTFAEQLGNLLPTNIVRPNSLREFPVVTHRYPGPYADQFL
ncbi:uncharacterized protein LOC130691581 [Daphnia carinata]|uniref:uncharacterized protein LOC130691581 n=1 Tax=Daphnia carinata TaxID=120202 RepID=UPI00257B8726|nr:uncharacterized protein LOC130691581 [Daphnia carinata]